MVTGGSTESDRHIDTLRRQVRLIILLDAAENAGLTPMPILQLHTFAYLSNVLSPVWSMEALEGKVLKRRGGPFYPVLQHDLDRLVGMGVVCISNVSHVLNEEQRWRLEGSYHLHRRFADRILSYIQELESEQEALAFLQELAYAVAALSDDELERATASDATYADPIIDRGNVVDFAEWKSVNYSANAARYFENLLPSGARATRGEMLHLYVQHLYMRLHGEQQK